jgi:hypothetical protein
MKNTYSNTTYRFYKNKNIIINISNYNDSKCYYFYYNDNTITMPFFSLLLQLKFSSSSSSSSIVIVLKSFIFAYNSILIIISDRGKSNIKGDRGGMETAVEGVRNRGTEKGGN